MDQPHFELVNRILKKHLQDAKLDTVVHKLDNVVHSCKLLGRDSRDYSIPVQTDWLHGTRDKRGVDRDQFGKEVCVYLCEDFDLKDVALLKEVMLKVWKEFEDRGVPLHTALPAGEKSISFNDIPTPFSFTFETKGEWENKHGILFKDLDQNPDPLNPHHPLNYLQFSSQDLQSFDIQFQPEKYLTPLNDVYTESLRLFSQDIELFKKDEQQPAFNVDEIAEKITELNPEYDYASVRNSFRMDEHLKSILLKSPAEKMHSGLLSIFETEEKLYHLTDPQKKEEYRATFLQILASIEQDYDYLNRSGVIHPELEESFRYLYDNRTELIEKNPYRMQTLFCRLVHLNNQAQFLTQSDIKLTDDYKKRPLDAIQTYLLNREKSLSSFSFFFDKNRGERRAQIFQRLFMKYADNDAVKDLLIYCILASRDGSVLKECLSDKLGFSDRTKALAFYANKMKFAHNFTDPEALLKLNKSVIEPITYQANKGKSICSSDAKSMDRIEEAIRIYQELYPQPFSQAQTATQADATPSGLI